jgi:hypothetical protein
LTIRRKPFVTSLLVAFMIPTREGDRIVGKFGEYGMVDI